VLTTDAFSSKARQDTKYNGDGLEICYARNLSNYLAWNHQLFLPFGTRAFLRKRAMGTDIIHIHMYRTYQNVAVRRFALSEGIPYILSAHGTVLKLYRKKLAKSIFDMIAGRSVLEDAARLVALSDAEAGQYRTMNIPKSKIVVIPNGIDAREFSNLPARGAFLRENGLNAKKLITYIGRLNARKGLDTLIESFQSIASQRADVALALVGPDDGYRAQIEKLIKRLPMSAPIVLTGWVAPQRKLEVLVDSDVVVYPGAFEIFGLVPFEALICGRPVIVANDSGCGEILAEADGGLTIPFGDSKSLQVAIEQALENPDWLKSMTERGRRYVLERLDWKRIAEKTEQMYRDVVAARTR
jgi:glycosyltransferase involved in cell wall biosynthesis